MRFIIALLLMVGLPLLSNAQVEVSRSSISVGIAIPEIALLDIEPNNSAVSLELRMPMEAGNFIKNTEQANAKWINYSSSVVSGRTRSVTVQLEYGQVPAGTTLKVQASGASGGKGALGLSAGIITLSTSPEKVITAIGGAVTGNGANLGHSLSYFLEVNDVSRLDFNSTGTVGIIYTLTDN